MESVAAALFTDFGALPPGERNMARHIFLDPAARTLHGDWETAAMDSVGILRLATKRPPLEEPLVSLLAELSARGAPTSSGCGTPITSTRRPTGSESSGTRSSVSSPSGTRPFWWPARSITCSWSTPWNRTV